MHNDERDAGAGQYLTFFIASDEYAINILRVREIIEFNGATHVPGAPRSVIGVINLRGRVVPVVDLAVRIGAVATVPTSRTCAVILEVVSGSESLVVGLIAESVHEVIELAASDIEPPPSFGTRIHIDFLLGVGRHRDGLVLLLDPDRLLSQKDAAAIEAIPEPAEVA